MIGPSILKNFHANAIMTILKVQRLRLKDTKEPTQGSLAKN